MTTHASQPVSEQVRFTETMPANYYNDPAILEIEKKEIFGKSWQYVATADALAKPGDYVTVTLADVPVVVSRSRDGLHAMVNVCRHRMHEVASGCGNTRAFSCPYHAWTYSLSGSLIGAPRSENVEGFDKTELPLKPLQVKEWGPLIFVNLDPMADGFDKWLNPVDEALRSVGVVPETLKMKKRTTFDIAGNWKIVAENFLECYHCVVAHPEYARTFDTTTQGFTFSVDGQSFIAEAQARPFTLSNADTAPYKVDGPIDVNQNDFLFPNFGLMTWPGQNNLITYSFLPTSVDHCIGYFDYFFDEDADPEFVDGFIDFLDEVGTEDLPLIEAVQRGLHTGRVDTGWLAPDEGQIVHFQKLVRGIIDASVTR
jgi:phenylpropionate dioxygenase-like ring-hydroxylating dioxygenase large terminal subunit